MKTSLFKVILLGVFGLGALIGLFVFATYSGKNNDNGGAVGTVVIWGTLPASSMQSALAAATQTEALLKSVSYVQKAPATLSADLASAIATGVGPDLVLASQEELLALTKFITPVPFSTLSSRTFTSAFVEEGGLLVAPGGAGYWGVPFLIDPLVLFSNRSILSSTGIAKPPATWEALTGLVPNVALFTPSRQVTRGLIALGTYDNVDNARGILSTLFLQQQVPLVSYAANGNFFANLGLTTTTGAPPGSSVVGFYTQFADPSKISYTWNASLPNSRQAFLSGDLALYLGYASEARYLRSANPNLNFDVSPVPQPATAQLKRTYGLLYSFLIPRGAKNSVGAYQAAALLVDTDEQNVAASYTGLAPASLSPLTSVPNDSIAAVAYAGALYAGGWLSPAPADTNRVFSSMIGDVISGRSSLQTALSSAERSLNALLQQ